MKQGRTRRHGATSTVLKWSKCNLTNVPRYVRYASEDAGKKALSCWHPQRRQVQCRVISSHSSVPNYSTHGTTVMNLIFTLRVCRCYLLSVPFSLYSFCPSSSFSSCLPLSLFRPFFSSSFILGYVKKARINTYCGVDDLYSSLDIIRAIKQRRMWWLRHLHSMGEKSKSCRVLVGEPIT